MPDTRHVLNTDPRQNPGDDPLAAADAIEQAILAEGAENVCMVILEPVQNAGGTLVPPPGYAQRVREICDRHGVLLCCDEVDLRVRPARALVRLRAPRLQARPDHVREGRHLRATRRSAASSSPRPSPRPCSRREGMYAHGYTFGGHPVSCAVALANLAIMERVGALANVLEVEPYLESVLNEVAASSPIAVEARGCGFFRSLELVDAALVDRVRAATRARGVIVRTDVRANPCLAISPPLISDRSQVDELAEALAGGLAEIAG